MQVLQEAIIPKARARSGRLYWFDWRAATGDICLQHLPGAMIFCNPAAKSKWTIYKISKIKEHKISV